MPLTSPLRVMESNIFTVIFINLQINILALASYIKTVYCPKFQIQSMDCIYIVFH